MRLAHLSQLASLHGLLAVMLSGWVIVQLILHNVWQALNRVVCKALTKAVCCSGQAVKDAPKIHPQHGQACFW